MNPYKIWQEVTISDEELEDIIAGIPHTRRGQRRDAGIIENAPYTTADVNEALFNNDNYDEEDDEYYD